MDMNILYRKITIWLLSSVLFFSFIPYHTVAQEPSHSTPGNQKSILSQIEETQETCKIVLKFTIGNKQYFVNEEPLWMDTEPEIKYNRTHLVIRYVLQHIPETTLEWNNAERKVSIRTAEGKEIKLWIGQYKAEVNGVMVEIDPDNPGQVAPYIKNSRTYLPMRFVVEQMDAEVVWNSKTQTAVLTVQDKVTCQCEWVCGSIYNKDWVRKDDGMIQFYFDEQSDNKNYAKLILVKNSLKDQNHGLEFEQYLKLYTSDYCCAELCFNKQGNVVKWKATPEKFPYCCGGKPPDPEPPPEPKPAQYGRITGTITGEGNPFSIKITGTGETTYSGMFMSDEAGKYQSSKEGETCIIPAPGTYRITPEPRSGYLFSPLFIDLSVTESCPGKSYEANFTCKKIQEKGRIVVKMSPSCFEGTTFKITARSTGKTIYYPEDYKGIKKESGVFDTLCTLECKEAYLVEPTNASLLFHPASQTVSIDQCCPENAKEIRFECKNPQKGRITGSLTLNGNGADISILKVGDKKENALIIQATVKGFFDTGCVLECGATYIVTPTKDRAKFDPPEQQVTIKNCCPDGAERIDFACDFSRNPCCDWVFQVLQEAKNTKLMLCPGETRTVESFEIVNNCQKGSTILDFTITWPDDGKIISITPNEFYVSPLHQQTLQITVKMKDPCEISEVVSFPFTIHCRQCGEKQVNIIAFGKDCWCNKTSYVIKVTKINLREGWLEEIPGGEIKPVRFYFDPKEDKWAHIKIGRCIEICVEGRKDKDGNIIFWALDWRGAECLNSFTPPLKYFARNLVCLTFESDSTWKRKPFY